MPGYGNFVLDKGYKVASSTTITKHTFVKFSADDTITNVAASTDVVCGVALVTMTTGVDNANKGVPVRLLGIAEVESAATINAGQLVMSNTSGKALVATSTNRVVGMCLKGCTNGQRTAVLLITPGYLL